MDKQFSVATKKLGNVTHSNQAYADSTEIQRLSKCAMICNVFICKYCYLWGICRNFNANLNSHELENEENFSKSHVHPTKSFIRAMLFA